MPSSRQALVENIQSPKVSIGLPVYNGARYIREALDSVLAQSFRDFELIISDNASTDETETICESYAKNDPRIRYVRQTENRGGAYNFQYVMEQATGKYFKWLAHDDRLEPDFLTEVIRYLDDHDDVVLCTTDVKCIDELGGVLNITCLESLRGDGDWIAVRRKVMSYSSFKRDNLAFLIYGVYRLDQIRNCNVSESGLWGFVNGSEYPWFCQIAPLGKIVALPLAMIVYRRHVNSGCYVEVLNTSWRKQLVNRFYILFCMMRITAASGLPFIPKCHILLIQLFVDLPRLLKNLVGIIWQSLLNRTRRIIGRGQGES